MLHSDKNSEHIIFKKEKKMFKLLIAALTSLGLMVGGAEPVTSQINAEEQISSQQQEGSVEEPLQVQTQTQEQFLADEALQTQSREMLQLQEQNPLCDPAVDPLCVPIQDQLRDQTQDQLRLHQDETTEPLHLYPQSGNSYGDGDGTCDSDGTPATEPGQHGNGH